MRVLIALLLFCVAASSSLMKIGILTWYECNKTYIAQNLCENRDKPQLKCCGKCYLRKQLAKAETNREQREKPLSARLLRFELPAFVLPHTPSIAFRAADIIAVKYPPYAYPFAAGIMLPVLHPPG